MYLERTGTRRGQSAPYRPGIFVGRKEKGMTECFGVPSSKGIIAERMGMTRLETIKNKRRVDRKLKICHKEKNQRIAAKAPRRKRREAMSHPSAGEVELGLASKATD